MGNRTYSRQTFQGKFYEVSSLLRQCLLLLAQIGDCPTTMAFKWNTLEFASAYTESTHIVETFFQVNFFVGLFITIQYLPLG